MGFSKAEALALEAQGSQVQVFKDIGSMRVPLRGSFKASIGF